MEELIVQLLKDNGRVILPEFGALIVKTKTPFKVIFNEFLQYNDGALIGAIAKNNNIEREDAARKVKEFVAKVISNLDHGKQIDLGEIGVLSKSSTGKISLDEAGEQAPASKSEAKPEEKKDAVEFDLSDEPKDTPQPKPTAASVKKTPEPDKKPEPKKKEPAIVKAAEPIKSKPTPIKKEVTPKQPVIKEPMPINEYYEENNSKKKLNYILWGILIVIVNGAIIGYFLFDDEVKSIFSNNKTEQVQSIETPEINDNDAMEAAAPVEEELIIEDDTEEVIPVEESNEIIGKKYFVVAGVFKDETNADNLVITLRNQGYNAEKFGKIGALHAVCYDVFPTKKEADNYMLKLKKEVDSETWIKVVE